MEQTCFSCWFIHTRTCRCVCAHVNPTEWYIPARFGETLSSRRLLVWGNDLKPINVLHNKSLFRIRVLQKPVSVSHFSCIISLLKHPESRLCLRIKL